jgi:hypothetical protein
MNIELLDFKELESPISYSGIEFYDDKVYLIGADAKDVLELNKKWSKQQLIPLLDVKDDKSKAPATAKLESMTRIAIDKKPQLLFMGSGQDPTSHQALILNIKTKATTWLDLSLFYNRVIKAGVGELNIEGIALIYDYLVLVNRGTTNQLIVTKPNFWKQQEEAPIQILDIDFGLENKNLSVTGLAYSDNHEDLFITTTSSEKPGSSAGKSYLGIIENLYRKIGREKNKIKVNQLIDLNTFDKGFKGYKMASVCIQSEKDHSIKLQMVGNGEKGKTFLFKVFAGW